MIIGIGNDLCNIERIAATISRHGSRFVNRIFSPQELSDLSKYLADPCKYASSVAKRFAAKEACSKALGTGLQQGTYWRDMQISHFADGRPQLILSGGALQHFQRLCGSTSGKIWLTITDDYPWAQAFVIIETN